MVNMEKGLWKRAHFVKVGVRRKIHRNKITGNANSCELGVFFRFKKCPTATDGGQADPTESIYGSGI